MDRVIAFLRGRNRRGFGEHPDMNVDEGHLGGYIRGRRSAATTVFGYEYGDPQTWTPELWRWAYETLGVRSVLDIGCGEGHSTAFFRDLGCRVLGVDGSVQARRDSVVPEFHVTHDFTRGAYRPAATFDLIWCCEFVEHVEERYLDNYLKTLARGTGYLMMTFAEPGQVGFHHVNCQPADYWIGKIGATGFHFDATRTEATRAIASPGHYRSRGLFFVKVNSA
jgi:SAM-dependent methyltransferase